MLNLSQRIRAAQRGSVSYDFDTIRRDYPLADVVAGTGTKLVRAGSEWKACCPLHSDRIFSFTIFNGGRRFQCFGCGAGGDVLDFVQACHGVDLAEAARLLGADALPVVDLPAIPARDTSDRTGEALAIWRAAQPVEGTPAETYLRWRGITCELPISLRYAVLPLGRSSYPCLVCCVSSAEGPLQAVQRIFLAPDGRGKADVPKPKLSLGPVGGGAIRLGPLDGGECVVVAGPEDGLTLLQELGRPVWAAPGDAMLAKVRFPPEVKAIAIGGDNDASGREAAEKAALTHAQSGLAVRTFYPPAGSKDFNEFLNKEAAQ